MHGGFKLIKKTKKKQLNKKIKKQLKKIYKTIVLEKLKIEQNFKRSFRFFFSKSFSTW